MVNVQLPICLQSALISAKSSMPVAGQQSRTEITYSFRVNLKHREFRYRRQEGYNYLQHFDEDVVMFHGHCLRCYYKGF